MRLAFRTQSKPRVESTVYLATFAEAFAWATERRLNVLYDAVADQMSTCFAELLIAGREQLEVLRRVAEDVGLDGFSPDEPLADADDEQFVQRITWRTAARWTVLSLLWTLAEEPGRARSANEWAAAVPIAERRELLGGSDLPDSDELMALRITAAELVNRFAEQNAALLIRDLCLVIGASSDTSVAATAVRPLALVCTEGSMSETQVELRPDDRVWLAGDQTDITMDGECRQAGELLTATSEATLRIERASERAPVVRDVALLFERDPAEHGR